MELSKLPNKDEVLSHAAELLDNQQKAIEKLQQERTTLFIALGTLVVLGALL